MDVFSVCHVLTHLKMYPVFDVVSFILSCIILKEDIQKTVAFCFAKQHPLASWTASMLMCFSAPVLACLVFNKPLASVLIDHEKIALASLTWYLINYSPQDIVYKTLTWKPCMCVLVAAKEVHRVYGISAGLTEAEVMYKGQFLVQFVAGCLRGGAAELMLYFARLVAGVMRPNANQFLAPNVFLAPSSIFKASCMVSCIFLMESSSIIRADHSILFTAVIATLVAIRLSAIIFGTGDPFVPFENLFGSLFFGGMGDALRRVIGSEKKSHVSTENGTKQKRS